jgi:hypothetical protein
MATSRVARRGVARQVLLLRIVGPADVAGAPSLAKAGAGEPTVVFGQ